MEECRRVLRPAKKAMRNSLVRFGKRGDMSDSVFQGESLGPGESDGLFFEREQQRIPVQYSYY
ncbi:hypothetical protein ANCDUO_19190 [Ancylostoma duodenale]|uniref:Uncharacterized protein n=1 Tax=Ancylostoma duodenale TaxID=51022 RepID=A0A0C2C368_9BILA|nr:hypothetical protein ANCDUO_19190 [Ancylostoma duodenale]